MRELIFNAFFALVLVGVTACGGGGGSNNTSQPVNSISTSSMSSSANSLLSSRSSVRSADIVSSSSMSRSVTSSSLQGSSSSLKSASSSNFSVSDGMVHFVPYFEPNSQWSNNIDAQNAMVSILAQFETTLRTNGNWNTTIEVYFNDNESSAYASAQTGSWTVSKFLSRDLMAPTAWVKIFLGNSDPNGAINANTGVGADITINWNFSLSMPENNSGLLRHELLHGLGMVSFLSNPSWSPTTGITKPNVGKIVLATIFDAGLVDLGNRSLLGDAKGNAQHVLNDYAVDSDWNDSNKSGIAFVGVLDSGAVKLMPIYAGNPSGGLDGAVDFSHVFGVSYANDHPDWALITEADRALLRGLGYKVIF